MGEYRRDAALKPYYQHAGITIYNGDCLEVMASMPADSVDAIVADGPYGLSFMGKGWDHAVPGVEYWSEMLRVAKPGGYILSFGGTRLYHRMICAIEDAGWAIRDCIMWVYGSGFPKSHNLQGDRDGWGTALKPAWEPIFVARKPFRGTVADNVLEHGTGALNIDGCRVETNENLSGGAYAEDGSDRHDGAENWRYKRKGGAGEYIQPTGRWPANLIHDGSEEVLALFPDSDGANGSITRSYTRHKDRIFGEAKIKPQEKRGDSGSAARFFYCAKASRQERNEGLLGLKAKQRDDSRTAGLPGGENPYNRGAGEVLNHHPTVKPLALMRYLCRLVTPPGGTVLDPFMGSGSTLLAARDEGFKAIGIDLDPEYCEIARRRIHRLSQMVLQL